MDTSVFISYRRTASWALANLIRDDLQRHQVDVWMDVDRLRGGEFELRILNEIANRSHFVVVLQPGSFHGINDPEDWLRREIACAIRHHRSIVPIVADGFTFDAIPLLPPDVAPVADFNGIELHRDYIEAGLARLRNEFLRPVDVRSGVGRRTRLHALLRKPLGKLAAIGLIAIIASTFVVLGHAVDLFGAGTPATNAPDGTAQRPRVSTTIRVGRGPQELAIASDGRTLYNTNQQAGAVAVIDTTTNTMIRTIPVGVRPVGVAMAPDDRTVYITNEGSGTTSVIAVDQGRVVADVGVGMGSDGIAFEPDGGLAYVTNAGSDTVSVINTRRMIVMATIVVGHEPTGIAVAPSGSSRLYVTNKASSTVSAIDVATGSIISTTDVDHGPSGIAISKDGRRAFVTNNASTTVSVIDVESGNVIDTIAVGNFPARVAISPDGRIAYVTNAGSGTVSVIDTATDRVTSTLGVGVAPIGVVFTPDGHQAYVANLLSDDVSVIETGL